MFKRLSLRLKVAFETRSERVMSSKALAAFGDKRNPIPPTPAEDAWWPLKIHLLGSDTLSSEASCQSARRVLVLNVAMLKVLLRKCCVVVC